MKRKIVNDFDDLAHYMVLSDWNEFLELAVELDADVDIICILSIMIGLRIELNE